jgi:hypothetical protein
VDADGVFYQCTSGGTPGSWSPVGTLLLGGENTSPDSTTISATADNGVYATTTSDGHSGLYASDLSTGGGQGVTGTSTSGTGVSGDSTDGYGLVGTGGLAPLLLTPATSAGAPTTGTHNPGEIYTDVNAVVFVCVSAGAPGTWVQVAAGPTAYASGASCLLPAPIRLLDTRAYATAPDHPGVPITGGDYITVPITGQEVGGVSVPAGAVAVIGNVTAVNAMARGYLTLWPSGVTRPGTSSINFPATTATANGVTVALSSEGTLDIYASQTTDVLFDATGFIA